jgi:hypothetical protein
MTYLVQVTTPWACFWYDVRPDGRVGTPPPIAAWMRGRRGRQMMQYWVLRGAQVTWQEGPT